MIAQSSQFEAVSWPYAQPVTTQHNGVCSLGRGVYTCVCGEQPLSSFFQFVSHTAPPFLYNTGHPISSTHESTVQWQRIVVQIRAHNHYQPDTKSNRNPNPDPTTKQHAVVSIQLNVVTCPTPPEKKHTRHRLLQLSVFAVTYSIEWA